MRATFLILFLLLGLGLLAQEPGGFFADSLKKRLEGAKTTPDRVHFLLDLAFTCADSTMAESYATEALTAAELSRDRRLVAEVYLRNGGRYLNNQGLEGNLQKGQHAFEEAERVAKENGLAEALTETYYSLSVIWRVRGNNEKALAYSNQALAAAITSDIDTAKVWGYRAMGATYMNMKQMPLSFQNFSQALTIAEESGKNELLRTADIGLTHFYAAMHEYGKAIDYTMKAYDLSRQAWVGGDMLTDIYDLGDLFAYNKQRDLAMRMYERSIALADTLHYDLFKINSYFRIFSLYFRDKEFSKGYHYLISQKDMLYYLDHLGFSFYVGEIKAMAFSEEGRYDSALWYFRITEPRVTALGNQEMQYEFFTSFGDYYIRRKDYPGAIRYYGRALALMATSHDLEQEEITADTLQNLYERAGDYRSALLFNRRAAAERDSLRAQTQETELMKLEVETANRRRERIEREAELNTEHRHNIQYMGFTAGLVLLFIAVVLLGHLTVPVSVIRTVVFLSFIFLFEFIILLLDKPIQGWTGDEPWKMLLIKIVLAAGLVPLHHWLEHRVIHYLGHKRRPAVVQEPKH